MGKRRSMTMYGLAKLYEDMADAGKIERAKVRCDVCKREQEVNGATALRDGWPLCHGYTMHLVRP